MKKISWMTGSILTMSILLAGCANVGDRPNGAKDAKPVEFIDSGRYNLPFSDAVQVSATKLLFMSGTIGAEPGSDQLVKGGIKPESRQALDNIKTALESNGYEMTDVVKCTVMLADIAEWPAFNEVYKTYFSKPYPARSAFGGTQLVYGARLELECIAAK